MRWLRDTFPTVYEQAAMRAMIAPSASGTIGDLVESVQSIFDKFVTTATSLAQTYVDTKAQIDWLKLNADRAKKGLPPLDPATGQPVASQSVTAPPASSQAAQVEQHIAGSTSSGVPPWAWIVGAGVLLAFMISRR